MLVIVKDRYLHGLFQLFLNVEAFRSLYILKIYAAECRFKKLACLDDLVRVFSVKLNIKYINIGKTLEKNPFPLHNRFAGKGAKIAQSKHRRAV